jgi:hypothetical protein
MPDDSCLKRRLLFASVQTYHPDEPVRPGAPGWKATTARTGDPRWTTEPSRVPGGAAPAPFLFHDSTHIDFALVGPVAEGIVVAFRGTLPPLDLSPDGLTVGNPAVLGLPVVRDWGNDLRAQLRRGVAVSPQATIAGAVHEGFAASLAGLWPGIANRVDALRSGNAASRLYFTGHSKGGALANLGAYCARRQWPGATVRAATFGAPRAGDIDFAAAYQAEQIVCERYEVSADVVPQILQGALVRDGGPIPHAYKEVGTPHDVALISYAPRLGRFSTLVGIFRRQDDRPLIHDTIAAHLPYRGFGYGDHVCEPGCRHDWR